MEAEAVKANRNECAIRKSDLDDFKQILEIEIGIAKIRRSKKK
jgi:hypothetical protein